jgi:hypothetical protein
LGDVDFFAGRVRSEKPRRDEIWQQDQSGRAAQRSFEKGTARRFCHNFGVAQIFNLLYRRIAFGMAPDLAAASGLKIRDTAECNSALRFHNL